MKESRKPLSRDNNCLDRLRTRNRNVAQDLLMHAMMIKSFLSELLSFRFFYSESLDQDKIKGLWPYGLQCL